MHSATFMAFAAWRTDAQHATPGYAAAPIDPTMNPAPAGAKALRAPPRTRRHALRAPPARCGPEAARG